MCGARNVARVRLPVLLGCSSRRRNCLRPETLPLRGVVDIFAADFPTWPRVVRHESSDADEAEAWSTRSLAGGSWRHRDGRSGRAAAAGERARRLARAGEATSRPAERPPAEPAGARRDAGG